MFPRRKPFWKQSDRKVFLSTSTLKKRKVAVGVSNAKVANNVSHRQTVTKRYHANIYVFRGLEKLSANCSWPCLLSCPRESSLHQVDASITHLTSVTVRKSTNNPGLEAPLSSSWPKLLHSNQVPGDERGGWRGSSQQATTRRAIWNREKEPGWSVCVPASLN